MENKNLNISQLERSNIDSGRYQPLSTSDEITNKCPQSWLEFINNYWTTTREFLLQYLILYKIPILIFISIFIGVVFYHYINSWPISTAIFYSVNTLLGELFMVPGNKSPIADVFTVLYYIYGAFFLAGILGQYVGVLVAKAPEIAATERKKLMEYPEIPSDIDQDGYVGFWDHIEFHKVRIKLQIGWEVHKWKYITFLIVIIWLGVGILYGMVMEQKEFPSALFFAVSTIAGACYVGKFY